MRKMRANSKKAKSHWWVIETLNTVLTAIAP